LLSAVIHVVCMYLFADWALGGAAAGLRQKARDWFEGDRVPPMRVEMMHADPMRIAEKVQGERDTPSRGPIEAGDGWRRSARARARADRAAADSA
jgi:hypothetical protein